MSSEPKESTPEVVAMIGAITLALEEAVEADGGWTDRDDFYSELAIDCGYISMEGVAKRVIELLADAQKV